MNLARHNSLTLYAEGSLVQIQQQEQIQKGFQQMKPFFILLIPTHLRHRGKLREFLSH